MRVLVMTGATVAFPALLDAFDDMALQTLRKAGFTHFCFQYGFAAASFARLEGLPGVTGFSRTLDITPHIDEADVVVCPAGAGSILDVLRRPNPPKLVVCVNTALLDNHQLEIASQLTPEMLLVCEPGTVAQGVADAATRTFAALSPAVSLQPVLDELLRGDGF